eukprot:84899_1
MSLKKLFTCEKAILITIFIVFWCQSTFSNNIERSRRLLHSLKNNNWKTSSTSLPRNDYEMACGYYNQSIYLLGGYENGKQLIEYNILSAQMIDHGITALAIQPNESISRFSQMSQFYTQKGDTLYMLNEDENKLFSFELKTKLMDSYWNNIDVPGSVIHSACLTLADTHLFIVGGSYRSGSTSFEFKMLDFKSNIWTSESELYVQRADHACIIHPVRKELYAIGGYKTNVDLEHVYLQSVERINIENVDQNDWNWFGDLLHKTSGGRAIIFNRFDDIILVFGGFYYDSTDSYRTVINEVQVIDCISGTVTSGGFLDYAVYGSSVIIVDSIFYMFGGMRGSHTGSFSSHSINSWQYLNLQTQQPTNQPTTNPTSLPSDNTINPSISPTNDPTFEPTFKPTIEPTTNPTNNLLPTHDIIIKNHKDINTHWIAFNVTNIDTTCGEAIKTVYITGSDRNDWIKQMKYLNGYYIFDLENAIKVPISIMINKSNINSEEPVLIGRNIITSFDGGKQFNFRTNFCTEITVSEKFTAKYSIYMSVAIPILAVLLICCAVAIWVNRRKHVQLMSNALVVIIGIGEYENTDIDLNDGSSEVTGLLQDLPIDIDIQNLQELFDLLNYKVIPKQMRLKWTAEEVINFLKYDVVNELFGENDELKYDSLIVFVSCHGRENEIITSDKRTIQKDVIHRIISVEKAAVRRIPRMFVIDSCDGNAQREYVRQEEKYVDGDVEEQKGKGTITLNDISTGLEWTYETQNPDFKLIQFLAANVGYQAMCNEKKGSYLIYELTKRMKYNVINKKKKTLQQIFEEIQNELHDKGKQQISGSFNNGTSNIVFTKK